MSLQTKLSAHNAQTAARVVPSAMPSMMDAEIETSERGLGHVAAKHFKRGVLRATYNPTMRRAYPGTRIRLWEDAGETWAAERIANAAGGAS